jgi:hypothetical protein
MQEFGGETEVIHLEELSADGRIIRIMDVEIIVCDSVDSPHLA